MNALISRANSARRAVVKSIESSVRAFVFCKDESGSFELPTALEADLTLVAVRPTSLGFSDHDLQHFSSFYAGLAEKKVNDWQWQNKKIQRMDRPSKEMVAERDTRYNRVKVVRTCLGVFTDESSRREGLRLQEARAYESKRAEVEARAAEQATEMEQVVEEAKQVIKLKAPRKSKSSPKVRKNFSKAIKSDDAVNPFELLKGELTERCRSNWKRKALKKADAIKLAGCSSDELGFALLMAQKMGTDEVLDVEGGVICWKEQGNSIRYQLFGAAA